MSDLKAWCGNRGFAAWRLVYAPDDLDTGPRQCRHAQRALGLRHLPLPKAGLPVSCVAKDGSILTRTVARTKANAQHVINLTPLGRE